MSDINIKEIKENDPLLPKIIKLADKNSATLGFLPRQVFYEHAAKKNILVATNQDNNLLGYLL